MASPVETQGTVSEELRQLIRQTVEDVIAEREATKQRKMAIIATKGTLDWAYPPLILATTTAALGWEVGIFFTFYGLNLIHKKKNKKLAVAPLGNPAMPMPVPNIVGALPGMTRVGTEVMKRMFKKHGVASIDELLDLAREAGVKMFPCGMTMDVFGYKPEEFIEGVEQVCGAAAFAEYAADADVSIFV
jgi:peroxiredoxin family protein